MTSGGQPANVIEAIDDIANVVDGAELEQKLRRLGELYRIDVTRIVNLVNAQIGFAQTFLYGVVDQYLGDGQAIDVTEREHDRKIIITTLANFTALVEDTLRLRRELADRQAQLIELEETVLEGREEVVELQRGLRAGNLLQIGLISVVFFLASAHLLFDVLVKYGWLK